VDKTKETLVMPYMQLIIGAPEMGKSPYAQKMIEGRRCFVFDINNEYGSRTKYSGQKPIGLSINPKDERCRYIGYDVKHFTELALQKRNTIIVMEEATAFFRGRQTSLTSRLIIGRKHTGNILLFLFHSINRVPPELMEMAEWVILLKTNDEPSRVSGKYAALVEPYKRLREMPNGSKEIIKLL
jgi:hypothetical protein